MARKSTHRFFTRFFWESTTFFIAYIIADVGLYYSSDWIRRHWDRPVDWIGLLALEIALLTLYLDFRLHRSAEQIASSATTRYLGEAPAHLGDLADLMAGARARDHVLVLLDFFGHGHYSDPSSFEVYFEEFKKAIQRKVNVSILVCDEDDVRRCTEAQFDEHKGDKFKDLKKSPKYQKWLEYYEPVLRRYKEPETYEQFIDTLVYINDDFCHRLLAEHKRGTSVEIRKMPAKDQRNAAVQDQPNPDKQQKKDNPDRLLESWMNEVIYIWIHRDRAMIFSFPRFYGAKSGDCFQTRDGRLIKSFEERFRKKWDDKNTISEIGEHIYNDSVKAVTSRIKDPKSDDTPSSDAEAAKAAASAKE